MMKRATPESIATFVPHRRMRKNPAKIKEKSGKLRSSAGLTRRTQAKLYRAASQNVQATPQIVAEENEGWGKGERGKG
jgi:hypothetical protein